MRKIALIFVFAILSCQLASAQVDSTKTYAGLDSLLTQFYSALVHEDTQVKNDEMDKLILTCQDSLTRQHVAIQVFDHYMHSRIMGEESVAIHIYDQWFASGLIKMQGEFSQMEAEMFTTFNRNSLIGMTAPRVSLYTPSGARKTIPKDGKVSVLFFYDTSCSKCMLESQVLPTVLKDLDLALNFYAVYVGTEKRDWNAFRRNFKINNPKIKLQHFWDPEMDSDYQLLYGVTGTPRLFVILEDGEIIGRRLEVANLQEILTYISIINGTKEKKEK